MKAEIEILKEVMHQGMVEAFKTDGALVPVVFFHQNGKPVISEIPSSLFKDGIGKDIIGNVLRNICMDPTTICAGIIVEAYGVKLNTDADKEDVDRIHNGDMKVSKHPKAVDIIIMILSTPESNEIIAYEVDCQNKTVGERFGGEDAENVGGRFGGFFQWRNN